MIHKIISLIIIISCGHSLAMAQEKCTHEQIIMNFLQTISAPHYKSRLEDFITFFDSESMEIEGGLRTEYIKTHPNIKISWDPNTKSFAIDQFLKNEVIGHLISIKNSNNCNWVILNSYKYGSSTIIYIIGIKHSNKSFQIKMVNWPNENRCGICDILDATGKSIYYK